MISRSLIELIFSSSSIERWNDHPRPVQFTEMAKQAHKFIIAYVIGRDEEDRGVNVDWQSLIEGSIFEFLHRVVVTDIKPPIFHRLMADKTQRDQLNRWVMKKLTPLLAPIPGNLIDRWEHYFLSDNRERQERKYLQAAHYLATKWEFDFICLWSTPIYRIESTKDEIYRQVMEHMDIQAVRKIVQDEGLAGFISLVGQLRFQKRWAQTPRIPQTSVLGHLLFVAILSWLVVYELGGCDRRLYNAFYGGLFHDLPEVLTRDIVSPVKRSVEGLEQMIKDLEMEAISQEVLPLIPTSWHDEILSFVKDEFENRIKREDGTRLILPGDLTEDHDKDHLDPIDGKVIEGCDKLTAFIEASESIRIGIKSGELFDGKRNIYEKYYNKTLNGYPIGILFDYFR
ncbi:HD domain-containing protein [Dethiosulfovibrio salsuginis]|uniref:Putative hydrolases of HD superfamily n=1 Tax=Dethiosulfovibrio salsuginis TaxID=561720 RepID=A0A1X7J6K6_9BACT|nr:HD domain-containing protein [Dethiosulfovibrio salsuginis]SMG23209.1 putative hydrolases of HD superfamily [Dethiosulfovibrio salsuginis]